MLKRKIAEERWNKNLWLNVTPTCESHYPLSLSFSIKGGKRLSLPKTDKNPFGEQQFLLIILFNH